MLTVQGWLFYGHDKIAGVGAKWLPGEDVRNFNPLTGSVRLPDQRIAAQTHNPVNGHFYPNRRREAVKLNVGVPALAEDRASNRLKAVHQQS